VQQQQQQPVTAAAAAEVDAGFLRLAQLQAASAPAMQQLLTLMRQKKRSLVRSIKLADGSSSRSSSGSSSADVAKLQALAKVAAAMIELPCSSCSSSITLCYVLSIGTFALFCRMVRELTL
jgi:hypothetical protein